MVGGHKGEGRLQGRRINQQINLLEELLHTTGPFVDHAGVQSRPDFLRVPRDGGDVGRLRGVRYGPGPDRAGHQAGGGEWEALDRQCRGGQGEPVAVHCGVRQGSSAIRVDSGRDQDLDVAILVVRQDDHSWSNPAFVTLTGGSFGFQAGVQSTDVILVFKTRQGVENIQKGKLRLPNAL